MEISEQWRSDGDAPESSLQPPGEIPSKVMGWRLRVISFGEYCFSIQSEGLSDILDLPYHACGVSLQTDSILGGPADQKLSMPCL